MSETRRARCRQKPSFIVGAYLSVDQEVIGNSLPMTAALVAQVIGAGQLAADQYAGNTGLPLRCLFYRFESGQFLALYFRHSVLLVLATPDAPLVELEIAAKKVISTAHITASLNKENPIVASLLAPPPVSVPVSKDPPLPAKRERIRTIWAAALTLVGLAVVSFYAWPWNSTADSLKRSVLTAATAASLPDTLPFVQAIATGQTAEAKRLLETWRPTLPPEAHARLSAALLVSQQRETEREDARRMSELATKQRQHELERRMAEVLVASAAATRSADAAATELRVLRQAPRAEAPLAFVAQTIPQSSPAATVASVPMTGPPIVVNELALAQRAPVPPRTTGARPRSAAKVPAETKVKPARAPSPPVQKPRASAAKSPIRSKPPQPPPAAPATSATKAAPAPRIFRPAF
jgi:hypothetical protein